MNSFSTQGGRAVRGRASIAIALCALTALAAGCGSKSSSEGTDTATSPQQRSVDAEQVEQGIETNLSTSSVKVTSASCPSDVPVQVGATFSCSVKLSNGGTGEVTVTQKGAGHYTYAFTPGSVRIPGTTAAAAIEQSLAAKGATGATVTCPETIVVKLNSPVTCNLSSQQGAVTGTVTFTFSEANGTVDPASVKTT